MSDEDRTGIIHTNMPLTAAMLATLTAGGDERVRLTCSSCNAPLLAEGYYSTHKVLMLECSRGCAGSIPIQVADGVPLAGA